ncbi:MAG: hypothetical protein NPINA01_25080 [Nitrospinaceae bacterium]|nr:MAG: hypothetical protein NPINA01_25080 [Nitrospinaceae bacterium]
MAEGVDSNIHLALVHFPVYNKAGEIVVSSVTTLDVHDSSRICRTYGIGRLYIVTPLKTQQELVDRMIDHWKTGFGATYNPTRKEALLKTQVKNSLKDVVLDITGRSRQKPRIVVTDARKFPKNIGYDQMREEFKKGEPTLLVFGTGWGLEKNIIENADFVLSPVEGPEEYNHLPVRAAIAVILDRLLGVRR